MAKPFDSTTKQLIEMAPQDWLEYVGLPRADVRLVDADLSSFSAAGDKILEVQETPPWVLHLELQSGYEDDMIERFHFYCVVKRRRSRLPIRLFVVLLRPEADGADVTGTLEYHWPDGTRYEYFRYHVIRAWQKPVEALLQGGLATLPLAPISAVGPLELPEVIRRMDERLSLEAPPGVAEDLWTATYLLMGLRYSPDFVGQLLQGVRNMRESSTYQAILEEGRTSGRMEGRTEGLLEGLLEGRTEGQAEEARKTILVLGRKRFGELPQHLQTTLATISDVETLDNLIARLLDVETWDELLTQP